MNTKTIRKAISAAMLALGLRSAEFMYCFNAGSGIKVMLDGTPVGIYYACTDEFVKER